MVGKTKLSAATLAGLFVLAASSCLEQVSAAECYPHCDYNHYLGPSDFTYISPGLYGYLVCSPGMLCSPRMVYRHSGVPTGRIEIRFPRRPRSRP